MIRLVLVDDEVALRTGLKMILAGTEDIEVVAEAGNGKDAVETISREQPDIVLMDIRMPVMDGIEATQKLQMIQPDLPIIMLTSFDTDEFILGALRAGAVGFMLKSTGPEALVLSIRAAVDGQQMLSRAVLENLLSMSAPVPETEKTSAGNMEDLSAREMDVATLVAEGLDNTDIAERLFISVTTVKSHIKHILEKIHGTNRVHIAIAVLEQK